MTDEEILNEYYDELIDYCIDSSVSINQAIEDWRVWNE